MRTIQRPEYIGLCYMLAIDIVEYPVIGLRDHGIGIPVVLIEGGIVMMLIHPLPGGIPHRSDTPRIGDQDRRFEETAFRNPMRPRHISIAVERIPVRIHRVKDCSARKDCRYPGSDRPLSLDQRAVALDQRHLADRHARHIGDRIEKTGLSLEWHSIVPRPLYILSLRNAIQKKEGSQKKQKYSHVSWLHAHPRSSAPH
jgi:hypothetical protein